MSINLIEKENWKKAKGVIYKKGQTNSALAERNYDIKCKYPNKITVIKGYFIWWCSTHHQPLAKCDTNKIETKLSKIKEMVK